eukprot:scaffold213197_cov42-Cyclotella_meneghiniana.AAC.2
MPSHTVKILLLFGKKIVKTDNNALTNQPEIVAIPPPLLSRVVGCWGVVAETEFVENRPVEVDESEIFMFGCVGDGGANSAEVEAEMTPPYRIGGCLSIAILRLGVGERAATELLRDWGKFSERSYLLYGVELRYLFGVIPSHTREKN